MDTLTAPRHLRLHASDNVIVAVDTLQVGQNIEAVTSRIVSRAGISLHRG